MVGPHLAAVRGSMRPGERVAVWVYLKDGARAERHADLSSKCVGRRLRTGAAPLIDVHDYPPSVPATREILATGARLRTISRYLGAVSVDASGDELCRLERISFVRRLECVASGHRREPPPPGPIAPAPSSLDYGASEPFLDQIEITGLHDLGLTGRNVLVGMLDTGYYRRHAALESVAVVDEWDFIHDDGCTENEDEEDAPNQHNHGTYTLSVMSAWDPGRMIGGAYGASYILAKTEDIASETPVEEDYWVEGLEWVEGHGADVVSSSLGYIAWYEYADLDGATAVTTQAARIAARKGVIVCNSVGNAGSQGAGSLSAPADADSILAVGAVSLSGARASFSSMGPTYDGRIKPDVMACGVSVVAAVAGTDSSYTSVNGTSLSTPLVACAAALLVEAHPDWTPGEVIAALRQSATRAAAPDNEYGWGVVRALQAHLPTDTLVVLTGRVRDAWSGGGVANAWVGWRGAGSPTWEGPLVTDPEGSFSLSLAPGLYEVLVQALGYGQITITGLEVPTEGIWDIAVSPVPVALGRNPCRGTLSVSVRLSQPGELRLELWDLAGRRVARTDRPGQVGPVRVHWNIRQERVPPGRFLLRWNTPDASGTIPILYLGAER